MISQLILNQGSANSLEAQTLHIAFEGLALEGAVEEQAPDLGSNSDTHMPPANPGAHERWSAGLWWPAVP